LFNRGFKCVVIDGDQLRAGLNHDLGFSEDDRKENLRRAAEVAAIFLNVGFVVQVPMISPS
jgi:adenylylsulfate kinase